ncbi:MAG: hypothetical protein V7651_04790 [Hyphomonas oceanitis]|uniref:hypothetical protein n=1 Tax=Hyphomonas oceanitis TaxID=81033 RepID=UPI003001147B
MKLASRGSVRELEKTLREVARSAGSYAVEFPSRITHRAAEGDARLIQLLTTWAQKQKNFVTSFPSVQKVQQLEDLILEPYALVALLLSDVIRIGKMNSNVTTEALELAIQRLEEQNSESFLVQARRRRSTDSIVCADHLGMGYPRNVYDVVRGEAELKPLSEFARLAEKLLRSDSRTSRSPNLQRLVTATESLLYEAFRNTHDHARQDLDASPLKKSVRGFFASHNIPDANDLLQAVSENETLAGFFQSSIGDDRDSGFSYLSISTFDSGIGFAQSWTKKPLEELSLAQESQAVLSCFEKHSSSGRSSDGKGLVRITDYLSEHQGFLSLRTGRTLLSIDYATTGKQIVPTIKTEIDDKYPLEKISGTALTLILPTGSR